MAGDHYTKRRMEELGRVLAQAIGSSSGVREAIRQIRHEGFSLCLVSKQDGKRGAQIELPSRQTPSREPVFRLDGNDVSFLKSVGIDPTRTRRRRRTS